VCNEPQNVWQNLLKCRSGFQLPGETEALFKNFSLPRGISTMKAASNFCKKFPCLWVGYLKNPLSYHLFERWILVLTFHNISLKSNLKDEKTLNSEISIESQGILEFLTPVSLQAVCKTSCNLRITFFPHSRLSWKRNCYYPQQLNGIWFKLWDTVSFEQDNCTAETTHGYQLYFPVMMGLVSQAHRS